MNNIVKFNKVEENIIHIRNLDVIIDKDVATLYGIETKRINEAVKNNLEKFPEGYIIELTAEETNSLRSNFSTLKNKDVDVLQSKNSTANISSKTRVAPKAFTEKGLYMLATILKSPKATQTTIAIVETFAKIRELSRTVTELSDSSDEYAQKNLMQKSGNIIRPLQNYCFLRKAETVDKLMDFCASENQYDRSLRLQMTEC